MQLRLIGAFLFSRKQLLALHQIAQIEPAWSSKAEAKSLNDLISFAKP